MLKITGLMKTFPGVCALNNVHLHLKKGSVHALLGENGAGKSTLIKTLAGVIQPDEGEIYINNRLCFLTSPREAHKCGIRVVYQELSVFDNLTVGENLYAAIEPIKYGLISNSLINEYAKKHFENLGIHLLPNELCSNLSLAKKQLLEIARAVLYNPQILILDEPTSSLSDNEINILFRLIQKLRSHDVTILFVSHKMEEIFAICDEVTVLKDGSFIGSEKISNVNEDVLIEMMVGRKISSVFPNKNSKVSTNTTEVVLKAENISHAPYYNNVSFSLHKGEILGLYGLMGSGRTEIAKGLFGVYPPQVGNVLIKNKKISIKGIKDSLNEQIAFVTENRKGEGLVLTSNVLENVNLAHVANSNNVFSFLNFKKEKHITQKYIKNLSIKTPHMYQQVNNLSGGNQQKVVLAKWFQMNPEIIIFDEPTRGIDVGAKFEIYELLYNLASKGTSILLISSELPEIMNLTDRILLIRNNTIISEHLTKECSEQKIIKELTGAY